MSLDLTLYADVDTGGADKHRVYLYEANYTHNCGKMAKEAGVYLYVWRPEECPDVKQAGDLVEPLRAGIKAMEDEPQRFIALNPENGWGSYDTFLPWLRSYLEACVAHPKALISAWR